MATLENVPGQRTNSQEAILGDILHHVTDFLSFVNPLINVCIEGFTINIIMHNFYSLYLVSILHIFLSTINILEYKNIALFATEPEGRGGILLFYMVQFL